MINIEHVSKQFGSLQVLEDISINIDQGDIFGIIGQSGAGKSTPSFSASISPIFLPPLPLCLPMVIIRFPDIKPTPFRLASDVCSSRRSLYFF